MTAPAVLHLTCEKPDPTKFPSAVAQPLTTHRIVNEAGLYLCKGFQGVSPRFVPDPFNPDVADFPSDHVAQRVCELMDRRLMKVWADKGLRIDVPMHHLAVAYDWTDMRGGWWVGRRSVDVTAISTAQLELGHELVAPCRNGAGR